MDLDESDAAYVRASLDNPDIDVVAVNDLTSPSMLAHLLQYDSTQGILGVPVSVVDGNIKVGKDTIKVFAERNPSALPWADLKIDVVIESTGLFTSREAAAPAPGRGSEEGHHLGAFERRGRDPRDGRQSGQLRRGQAPRHLQRLVHDQLLRANGQGPRRRLRHRRGPHDHGARLHQRPEPARPPAQGPRRARAAAVNIVPTSTGAARATSLVLAAMKGRLDGTSLRVPIPVGRITDFTAIVRSTTVEEINAAYKKAADSGP